MASVVPYGSTSPGLANNQKSNLRIAFNMGVEFNCDKCNKTINDCLCFCNECRKCLHPLCAGVETGITRSTRDGSKHIVLPAPEYLPVSCRDCLRRKPMPSAITDLLLFNNQGSSERALVTSSSITRFLESSSTSAHELMVYEDGDFLIHKSTSGHELEQKNYGAVYSCFGCKEKGFGPHHACRNESCSIRLHEECNSPRLTMMHPFFPGSSFAFHSLPIFSYCKPCRKSHSTISCNACGMDVNGYFYGSQDKKNHLHPCCANLPRQIKCGDTGATMVLQHETISDCCYCTKKTVKVDDKKIDKVWSYVSVNDNFHLHVACITKMLSDLKDGSVDDCSSRLLTLQKKIGENGVTEINLQIAARADTKTKWEKRVRTFMKYAKIALGAIISAFLGDPTTFFINLVVAFVS